MPKWLHEKLARRARRLGLSGDRFNAYVYGTLNKYEELHGMAKAARDMAKKRRKKR